MNTTVIAKGRVYSLPEGIGNGKIELNGSIVELPVILFEFWCQFQKEHGLDEARLSFEKADLPVELFDQSIILLKKEGLIEITTK